MTTDLASLTREEVIAEVKALRHRWRRSWRRDRRTAALSASPRIRATYPLTE